VTEQLRTVQRVRFFCNDPKLTKNQLIAAHRT
jgi:hypothetical protein